MEKEINQREQEGQLDKGFLSQVNAQLRQKKMGISQGWRPCCKRFCNFMLPEFSPNVVLQRNEINQREQEGQLDEGLLSEVNAQLWQAKEDVDKPGLEAMLQKVLQLYASRVLSRCSYAKKGEEVLKAEQFLEAIIQAPEEEWNKLLINGMTVGISPDEFYAVIKKRIERTLIRTEGGSYQQRVLPKYLKGIQSRAEEIVQVLQGKP